MTPSTPSPGHAAQRAPWQPPQHHDLPDFDPIARQMLARAGIHSLEELRTLGSVQAYVLTQAANAHVGLPLLWALESTLTGQPCRQVERQHRTRLLRALAGCAPLGQMH